MPRASTQRTSAASTANGSVLAQNVLKRNQACHQCRKRKLKCDAQMPCSACIKTHAHALKSHPETTGPLPDCSFDDPSEIAEGPKAKIQKLEEKIARLEALLGTQDSPEQNGSTLSPSTLAEPSPPSDLDRRVSAGSPSTSSPLFSSVPNNFTTDFTLTPNFSSAHSPSVADLLASLDNTPVSPPIPNIVGWQTATAEALGPTPSPTMQLTDPSWPANLPAPELLYHLIETFFTCVPHANRVIHRPTFMNSLILPPTSPEFPHSALLHAICAMASLYTPIITDGPDTEPCDGHAAAVFYTAVIGKLKGIPPPDPGKVNPLDQEHISFGMRHAKLTKESFDVSVQHGNCLVELLQAMIILSWFQYSTGRSVDVWISIGIAHRVVTPLGLNTSPGWTPVSRLPPAVLAIYSPRDHIVAELQRNLFWLTYVNERLYTAGTAWPFDMADEDISQMMPATLTDFISGREMPTVDRQRPTTHKMLTNHPPLETDAFTLYIKASIILGKIKTFNVRFRTKYNDMANGLMDPRETTEFQQLDSLITAFKLSIPKEFRNPVTEEGKVDPILYMAHLIPQVAMILLHDPHADIGSPNCLSSERILTSARTILELIYKISATSYDLILMDHAVSFCWFVCGAALIRFLKASIVAGNEMEMARLNSEIEIVRFMSSHLGERTLVGLRQIKLLETTYDKEIGPLYNGEFGMGSTTAAFVDSASLQEVTPEAFPPYSC